MFCRYCGTEIKADAIFCTKCGKRQQPIAEQGNGVAAASAPARAPAKPKKVIQPQDISPKTRLSVALLAFFLGASGVHRIYIGKLETGIVQAAILHFCIIFIMRNVIMYEHYTDIIAFLLLVAVHLWALVDAILVLVGKFKDENGKYILTWKK